MWRRKQLPGKIELMRLIMSMSNFDIRSLSRNLSMEVTRQPDAREVIKRKVPMGRGEQREDEDDEEQAVDVSQRRIAQPRRRLGERLGLAGRLDYSIKYSLLRYNLEH